MSNPDKSAPPPIDTSTANASPSKTSPISPQNIRSASYESEAASKVTSAGESDGGGAQPGVGTLLRLKPLTIHDLPTPPGWAKGNKERGPPADSAYWLGDAANDHPPLVDFIESILIEGHRFVKDAEKFKSLGETSSKPSIAPVEKTHRVVSEAELKAIDWKTSLCSNRRGFKPKKEDWYGRKSVHTTQLEDGTAPWLEFVEGLLKDHSEHEAEYDPSIYDCRCILDWNPQIAERKAEFDPRFGEISMRVMEMCHTIPVGQPRHFTTLVVSGKVHPVCFVTVQVPVDLSKGVPEAFYSSGRNVKEGATEKQRKKTIEGIYTSIEQCIHHPDRGEVTWTMTTASDAGGMLPMSVQKLAMPSQVAKDVGYFMEWVKRKFPRPSRSRQTSRASNGSKLSRTLSPSNGSVKSKSGLGSLRKA